MKAIIYSRVSNESQSTSRQINELKSLKEFEIKKTFKESISGYLKSVDERPELNKAITYAKKNGIAYILVHEISRLGRNTVQVLSLLERLKKEGIKVYIKSLGIAINEDGAQEPINKLIITLLSDLARLESETMSYRIKSGLMERKRKGLAVGRRSGSFETSDQFLSKHNKVVKYLSKGESIRWTANQLQISPTTVQKVKNTLSN